MHRSVISAVGIAFAIMLLLTLLPAAAERGVFGVIGFVAGVLLGARSISAARLPELVVRVFVAGVVGAIALPLLVSDTLPKLLRGEFLAASISLLAPLLIWLAAAHIRSIDGGK